MNKSALETQESVKVKAKKLMLRAKQLGVDIPLGHALELLSIGAGWPDWNHWSASLAKGFVAPVQQQALTSIYAKPGDGQSIAWRHYAMNVVDRNPKSHVIVVMPYNNKNYEKVMVAKEFRDRSILLEASALGMAASPWPTSMEAQGKILVMIPPSDQESTPEIGNWVIAIQESWQKWSSKEKTKAWISIDTHRYPEHLRKIPERLAPELIGMGRFSFTQMVEDMELIDYVGLETFFFEKSLHPSDKNIVMTKTWKANLHILSKNQITPSEHELQTMEGWLKVAARNPISNIETLDARGPSIARMQRMLKEEMELFEDRDKKA